MTNGNISQEQFAKLIATAVRTANAEAHVARGAMDKHISHITTAVILALLLWVGSSLQSMSSGIAVLQTQFDGMDKRVERLEQKHED